MQRWFARLFLMLALPFVPLVLVACGGGDDDDDEAAPPAEEAAEGEDDAEEADTNEVAEASMEGEWAGSYSTGVNFTLNLTQEGDALGGTYLTESGISGTVAGSISGNAVDMTITAGPGPTVAEFDGSVNDARTSMGGGFTIIAGGGGSGTWSATK